MISDLEVSRFKSLKHTHINNLSDINIFYGENNMGKSGILQALAFIAQSQGNSSRFNGELVNLDSYQETVYSKNIQKQMRFELIIQTTKEEQTEFQNLADETGFEEIDWDRFGTNLSLSEDGVVETDFKVHGESIGSYKEIDGDGKYEIPRLHTEP